MKQKIIVKARSAAYMKGDNRPLVRVTHVIEDALRESGRMRITYESTGCEWNFCPFPYRQCATCLYMDEQLERKEIQRTRLIVDSYG